MTPNPPEVPASGPPTNAREAVNVPGILLIITGALGALFSVLGMVRRGGSALPSSLLNDPNMRQWAPYIEKAQSGGIFINIIALVASGLVIYGAIKMRSLESYGLALTATILAMIPCLSPCCCIGLPLGIWSLVVLMKPEVKAAFQAS